MKTSLLIAAVLLAACSTQKEVPLLTGGFTAASFSVTGPSASSPQGRNLVGALDGVTDHIVFASGKKLHISSKLGLNYFGDTLFNYRLAADTLFLSNKKGKRAYPYVLDGDMLTISRINDEIKSLTLIPASTAAENRKKNRAVSQ